MSKIHISDIIKLRKKTGFGIMECKKSLIVMEGNLEKAIEFLRKTNKDKNYVRSEHNTTQGIVVSKVNATNKKGVIVVINCETDFVAKNVLFLKLANEIAETALNFEDKDKILSYSIKNIKIKEILFNYQTMIGEKLTFNIFEKIESDFVASYIHHGNKIAALAGFSLALPGINIIGKELAMQIAAMNPIALNKEEIPFNILKKEKEILKDQECREGRSKDLVEKIVEGKLKKFICDNTLLCQKYIKNQKITVQNYLKQFNDKISIKEYKRIAL